MLFTLQTMMCMLKNNIFSEKWCMSSQWKMITYIPSNNNMAVGHGDELIKMFRLFRNYIFFWCQLRVKFICFFYCMHAICHSTKYSFSPQQSRHPCDHRVPITGIIMINKTSAFGTLSLSQLSAMWSISPPPPYVLYEFPVLLHNGGSWNACTLKRCITLLCIPKQRTLQNGVVP
jgi:hypothetical protein